MQMDLERIPDCKMETGLFIGLETSLLSKIKLLCYGDFFYFPWYRYLVDKKKTIGMEGVFQASYSPLNSLDMLIKYSYKNKAKNYQDTEESKLVLPNIPAAIALSADLFTIECFAVENSCGICTFGSVETGGF